MPEAVKLENMVDTLLSARSPVYFINKAVITAERHRRVAAMRTEARAAGLAEAEVEKISTCPLVRLLVRGS